MLQLWRLEWTGCCHECSYKTKNPLRSPATSPHRYFGFRRRPANTLPHTHMLGGIGLEEPLFWRLQVDSKFVNSPGRLGLHIEIRISHTLTVGVRTTRTTYSRLFQEYIHWLSGLVRSH
jgi:hypothetical protein